MSGYSADVDGIFRGAGALGEASSRAKQLPTRFEADFDASYGWWGDEGQGDDFADQVGPACRREFEQILETITTITDEFTTLVDAIVNQGDAVRKPQDFAMDEINDQQSGPGRR